MFQERSPSELQDILDAFEVPMFAADRAGRHAQWQLVALNHAWENCAGQRRSDVAGKPLAAVFPPAEARWLAERFDECAAVAGPTHYSEERRIGGRTVEFDTSLQWAELPDGSHRVVGTSLAVEKPVAPGTRSAMAEIRDYAIEADYHLSRMLAFFEAEGEDEATPMSGLCRAVSSLLADIRRTAEAQDCLRHGQSPWAAAPVMGQAAAGADIMQVIGRQVLKV